MKPQPNALLQSMGLAIIAKFSATVTLTFCHGVFMLLFSITIASLLHRGLKSRSQQAMFTLAVISFTSATIGCAAFIVEGVIRMQSAMVDNLELPLSERLDLSNRETYHPGIVIQWTVNILPILSDSVVVWRAWIVFSDNRWVIIAPLLSLLGTIATTLVLVALYIDVDTYVKIVEDSTTLAVKLYYAGLAFSLTTNAVATSMIGYKLWVHGARLSRVLGHAQRITRAHNILVIFIESGVFYLALQLATITLALYSPVGGGPGDIIAEVFQDIYPELSGMYPMIVFVLVNNQHSFVDTYGLTSSDLDSRHITVDDASAEPATAGPLAFAPTAAVTTESPEGVMLPGRLPGRGVGRGE